MQRKNEFDAVRHVVRTVMTQTENICSVRCERRGGSSFFSHGYLVGKMCLTTNRDGNYRQGGRVAKYLFICSP